MTGPSTSQAPQTMLDIAESGTTVQTHRRDMKAAHPSRRSARNVLAFAGARVGSRDRIRHAALTANVTASAADVQPAPTPATRTPAATGPVLGPLTSRCSAVRLRTAARRRAHRRQQAGRRRAKKSCTDASNACEYRQHPYAGRTRDQQRRDRPLAGKPHEIRGHHHSSARVTVSHHPADQHAGDQVVDICGQHEPHVRGRAADPQYRERQRHGDHAVTEDRDDLAAEEFESRGCATPRSSPTHPSATLTRPSLRADTMTSALLNAARRLRQKSSTRQSWPDSRSWCRPASALPGRVRRRPVAGLADGVVATLGESVPDIVVTQVVLPGAAASRAGDGGRRSAAGSWKQASRSAGSERSVSSRAAQIDGAVEPAAHRPVRNRGRRPARPPALAERQSVARRSLA